MDEDKHQEPLFKQETLDRLLEVVGKDVVTELTTVFLTQARPRLDTIAAAVSAGDKKTLGFETHTLGSSSGTFGAQRMHVFARAAESACDNDDMAEASRLSGILIEIADETFAEIEAYILAQSATA